MASLRRTKQRGQYVRHERYTFRVSFHGRDGERRFVRLRRKNQREAESILHHVQEIENRVRAGLTIKPEQAAWIETIEQDLADKFAAAGLIEARVSALLGAFVADYIASRTDAADRTRNNFEQARGWLIKFFGEDKPLNDITAGHVDEFRLWLLERLGENTVRRHLARCKQFLKAAVRKRQIRENPFGDLKGCTVRANRARDYFVTREEAAKVLYACPDVQWKLLFALSRYGGLRCPSEHLALRWGEIDWNANRMIVRSPKTEHHDGKESRVVPLFPELRPHLEAAWDSAPEGAEFVITLCRDTDTNLRTKMERIIERAGLTPWPKLFANLRASRATELAAQFPAHVAAAWVGHSEAIAKEHYWRVRDEDFERATGGPNAGPTVAQTLAQTASDSDTTSHDSSIENAGDCRELAELVGAGSCVSVPPA